MVSPSILIVYSGKFCGDCQRLKAFLQDNSIDYEERDIRENPHWGDELEQKTGKLGVPYLIVDGEWMIGYQKGVGFTEEWARKVLAPYLT